MEREFRTVIIESEEAKTSYSTDLYINELTHLCECFRQGYKLGAFDGSFEDFIDVLSYEKHLKLLNKEIYKI